MNITMIMSGIDPQTKRFTEPPEQIKKEKDDLAQLEVAVCAKNFVRVDLVNESPNDGHDGPIF
jgi:hypothetical protein